jgi:iron complex outermembrane receptor protein
MKKQIISGTAVALVLGSSAWAQSTPSPTGAPATQSAAAASAKPAPSSARADTVEELIVTAQRREERLEEIPASVSAFNSSQLQAAGVTNVRDLTKLTPGLLVGQASYATQPTIRGVGSRSTASGDESQVAVYIDGVYQADLYATNIDLDNIERVEVLKGPQGTLFGRNATGGAINVITKAPSFTNTFDVKATYGSFDYGKFAGRVSGPLTSMIAADLSVQAYTEGSYIKNIATGRDVGGRDHATAQGKLLFEPTHSTQITLGAIYSNKVDTNDLLTNAWEGNTRSRTNAPALPIASEPNTVASGPFEPYVKTWSEQYSLHIKQDLGFASLEYTGADIRDRLKLHFDNDLVAADLANVVGGFTGKQQVHDVLLSSKGDSRFQWLAGGGYFHSKSGAGFVAHATVFNGLNGISGTGSTVLATVNVPIATYQDAKSYSAFFEGTLEVVDKLYLTAGYRYTDEKHSFIGTQAGVTNLGESKFTNGSSHVVLRYEVNPDLNVYASYAEGFKSGVYNGSSNSNVPANPETIKAYEAGVKATLASTLQVNAAIFHYDYTNLQVQSTPSNSLFLLTNAASSKINGAETSVAWRPMSGLRLSGNFAYLDAQYSTFPGAQGLFPIATTPLSGNIQLAADASGKTLIRAPKWTANAGVFWDHPLAEGTLTVDGNVYLTSSFYWDALNVFKENGYGLLDLGATWTAPSKSWSIRADVQNATDKEPAVANVITTNGAAARYQRPRSVNVTFSYHY